MQMINDKALSLSLVLVMEIPRCYNNRWWTGSWTENLVYRLWKQMQRNW